MGCISSKAMTRSLSYRQEMKQRSRRTAKGAPALPEDVLISSKGSNHFLALVCTATTMTDRLRSKSFVLESPKSAIETEDSDAIIKLHPVVNKDQRIRDHEVHPGLPKRSRSWHSFPLEKMAYTDMENHDSTIGGLELDNKGAIRSRSFHTVEEYDALLERIWFGSLHHEGSTVEEKIEKQMLTSSLDVTCHTEVNTTNFQGTLQPLPGKTSLVQKLNVNDETVEEGFPGNSTSESESKDLKEPSSVKANILSELSIKEYAPQGRLPIVKGVKRESIARGLETLKIPSRFELPAVASLREWLPGGKEFSPGANPTPKFGSYFVPTDEMTNKSNEESIFNDELVTALEEQLQQLKAEEETILKQITATWEDYSAKEIKEKTALF